MYDINKRIDRLENKIDKLSAKLDTSPPKTRESVIELQNEIRRLRFRNGIMQSAIVSAIVTTITYLALNP
ncbi:MAG: hypothetical protein IJ685_07360 [Selenomonadaceae bacterium]|nr:hypothetical protein [Selenomonadaceae bacterium]